MISNTKVTPPPPFYRSLSVIERIVWLISAILCVGTFFLFGFPERLGMMLGAGIMIGNVAFWRFMISRVLQKHALSANGNSRSVAKLILLGHLKLIGLAGLLYLMIRLLPLNPFFLLIGLSVLPMAAFFWAIYRMLSTLFVQDMSTTIAEGNH